MPRRPLAETFLDSLRTYADSVHDAYADTLGVDAWPEEQLKAPVAQLVAGAADTLEMQSVRVHGEVRAADVGRPDIGITLDGLLVGYIELKRPGRGANANRFTGHDRDQWNKFKNLPNVVYTDGTEFAHYRSGERVGRILRLGGDPTADGSEAVQPRVAAPMLELFRNFLGWQPIVPRSPKALAELLAPVSRLLRDAVETALAEDSDAPLAYIADDWRRVFFPDATNLQFADAYAQTLTYALLLARFSGAEGLSTEAAVSAIRPGHHLLAETLRYLGDPRARAQVETPLGVLERILEAVNPDIFDHQPGAFDRDGQRDPWLYFYEDFLAAYDARMRRDRGVYFTPWQVVQAQVRLTAQLLDERFNAPDAFADERVLTLDPGCGTGTYILAASRHGLDEVARRRGEGARASAATRLAAQTHAFEILVGPYAVAHLRLTQQILNSGGELPEGGAHVYLTDTLESPHETAPGNLPFALRELSEEHVRAQRVKRETPILVCIGNPPYDREQAQSGEVIEQRKGGWIRFGHGDELPPLRAFLDPLSETHDGVHAKNLYNDYVYFWRWALWKVCEQDQDHGIISFITASSYLRGPGFKGMRKVMRETFDDLWILDLGGDNRGTRKSENVFAIETPVSIAIGIRHPEGHTRRLSNGTPAAAHFTRIEGTEVDKLATLAAIDGFGDLRWKPCWTGWTEPFLPAQEEPYASWPLLTGLFPWQESGIQFKRTWPIAPDLDTLSRRWDGLLNSGNRARAFKESRDRKITKSYPDLRDDGRLPAISGLGTGTPVPQAELIGYRSFDNQWALLDNRLGDYLRPTLQRAHSDQQAYLTCLLTEVVGEGPTATATAHIPDLHHFRGSFGGKHVIPLWRNREATEANVTHGVLSVLNAALGSNFNPEDLFAYVYGLLSAPAYAEAFWDELETPGPKVPIAKDPDLFSEVVGVGRELLWLHTYGERFVPQGMRPGSYGLPRGRARLERATPQDPERYPEGWSYDADAQVLRIGEGTDAGTVVGIQPDIMALSVSGFEPVHSWLDNRMKSGSGRRSSPLDTVRPRSWTFDEELLDLLWILEATIPCYERANALLRRVIDGETFSASAFPSPTREERAGPQRTAPANGPLFGGLAD